MRIATPNATQQNNISETWPHLADQLDDLSQVLLLLQDLLGLGAQRHKLREVLVVVLVQSAGVLAVADQPVD